MRKISWPDFSGYRNIDLGLSRVYELLARLDNPHLKIPPVIHIAGTNGKGSTLSFLKQIFIESGLKVHSYTSPHLVNFNERITICNEEISDEFLEENLQLCKKAAEIAPKIPVTFFEGITVAAFLAFSKVKADILLLETGMGGRLDATNVIPQILAAVITPISFDHTDFLGNNLSQIAFEKAGIIKENCPVFVAKQKKTALETIKNQAKIKKSEIFILDKDFKITKSRKNFTLSFGEQKITLPKPKMIGNHQIENASIASFIAISQQKFAINLKQIATALEKTFWPARLQQINNGKFRQNLPKNYDIFLDGSHNLQGAGTIYKFLRKNVDKKIYLIFSMLKDKDCQNFLKKISDQVDHLFALEIPNEPKSLKTKEIKEICEKVGIKAQESANFDEAFVNILKKNKDSKESLILICGSLYLAGSFLAENK